MEVIILPCAEEAGKKAAEIFEKEIQKNPSIRLGLATGSTPLPLYRELIAAHKTRNLSFQNVVSFNLDEYVGVHSGHQASYAHFMKEHLFKNINIQEKNTFIPDGLAEDIPQCCSDYEKLIADNGGIDIQLLGIGSDGHIGFNEPTSSLASRTRIKTLTNETREDNARFFNDDLTQVPWHVITMGVGTIMESRHIILLAFGKNKARAVKTTIEGPVTSFVPASALQMHPKVTVFLDEEAASDLARTEYYKWVYKNKPSWQK